MKRPIGTSGRLRHRATQYRRPLGLGLLLDQNPYAAVLLRDEIGLPTFLIQQLHLDDGDHGEGDSTRHKSDGGKEAQHPENDAEPNGTAVRLLRPLDQVPLGIDSPLSIFLSG